jgi:hypothetical protein
MLLSYRQQTMTDSTESLPVTPQLGKNSKEAEIELLAWCKISHLAEHELA